MAYEGDRARPAATRADDYLDEQELESFPASDPHADWAGPPTWMDQEEEAAAARRARRHGE